MVSLAWAAPERTIKMGSKALSTASGVSGASGKPALQRAVRGPHGTADPWIRYLLPDIAAPAPTAPTQCAFAQHSCQPRTQPCPVKRKPEAPLPALTMLLLVSGTVLVAANELGKPCSGDAAEEVTCSGLAML